MDEIDKLANDAPSPVWGFVAIGILAVAVGLHSAILGAVAGAMLGAYFGNYRGRSRVLGAWLRHLQANKQPKLQ